MGRRCLIHLYRLMPAKTRRPSWCSMLIAASQKGALNARHLLCVKARHQPAIGTKKYTKEHDSKQGVRLDNVLRVAWGVGGRKKEKPGKRGRQ